MVGVHVLYCDSGTGEKGLKNTVLDDRLSLWWGSSSLHRLSKNEWMCAPTAFSFTSPHLRENLLVLPLHNVCLLDTCKCFVCWYVSSVSYLMWITKCSACPTVRTPLVISAAWTPFLRIRHRESYRHGWKNNRGLYNSYITHIQLLVWCPDEWSPACKWHEHFTFTAGAILGQWTHNIVRWEFRWDLTSEIPLGYWNMFLLYLFWSFLWLGIPSLDFCSCHYRMLECA